MRNSDTEEIEVGDTSQLEEELLGEEIPESISRSPDIVRDVGVAAPGVDQRFVMVSP